MTDKSDALPQRSEGGLAASDVFYQSYNSLYFYVEDADQENLYFTILKDIFPDAAFEKIFPLSGKSNVLSHAKDPENRPVGNRVYILDKDFDDLLEKKESIKGVFYLKNFCIENYVVQEKALVEVVLESRPKIKRKYIQAELSLDKVIPEIGKNLRHLFSLFYISQLEKLEIANCGLKPEVFCNPKRLWEVSPDLLSKYSAELSALCDEQNVEKPAEPLSSDPRLVGFHRVSEAEVVSGKFWLAMLFHYIKTKYNLGSITFDSFTFRTAKNCTFEDLRWLVDDVRALYF